MGTLLKFLSFLVAGTLSTITAATDAVTVYHCYGSGGVEYSDTPCDANQRVIEVPSPAISGDLSWRKRANAALGTEEAAEPRTDRNSKNEGDPCRHFQSTHLRTYLIREQVVGGMTQAHVRKAWGAPAEEYAEPWVMWIYDNKYHGRLLSITRVYFEGGCVTAVETVAP